MYMYEHHDFNFSSLVFMWPPTGQHFASQCSQFSTPCRTDQTFEVQRSDQSFGGAAGSMGQWRCNGNVQLSAPFDPSSVSTQPFASAFNSDGWTPSMVSNMMLNMQHQQFDSCFDQPEEEKRYKGTVKCFYGEKHTGHGFIACPEIYNRTGQDVYLHARQAHRCEVGDEVSFFVVFNSRKEPQARSVVKKAEEGKFLSKKREEAERQASALQQKRARIVQTPTQSQAAVMTEEQAKKFQKSLKGR